MTPTPSPVLELAILLADVLQDETLDLTEVATALTHVHSLLIDFIPPPSSAKGRLARLARATYNYHQLDEPRASDHETPVPTRPHANASASSGPLLSSCLRALSRSPATLGGLLDALVHTPHAARTLPATTTRTTSTITAVGNDETPGTEQWAEAARLYKDILARAPCSSLLDAMGSLIARFVTSAASPVQITDATVAPYAAPVFRDTCQRRFLGVDGAGVVACASDDGTDSDLPDDNDDNVSGITSSSIHRMVARGRALAGMADHPGWAEKVFHALAGEAVVNALRNVDEGDRDILTRARARAVWSVVSSCVRRLLKRGHREKWVSVWSNYVSTSPARTKYLWEPLLGTLESPKDVAKLVATVAEYVGRDTSAAVWRSGDASGGGGGVGAGAGDDNGIVGVCDDDDKDDHNHHHHYLGTNEGDSMDGDHMISSLSPPYSLLVSLLSTHVDRGVTTAGLTALLTRATPPLSLPALRSLYPTLTALPPAPTRGLLQAALPASLATWGDPTWTARQPLPHQARLTEVIRVLLDTTRVVPGARVDVPVPVLLRGVSTRLESPMPATRRQGMRIGNAFARVMDTGAGRRSVFIEEEVDEWTPEEWWPGMRGYLGGGGGGRGAAGAGPRPGVRKEGEGKETLTAPVSSPSPSPFPPPPLPTSQASRWTLQDAEAYLDSDDEISVRSVAASDSGESLDSIEGYDMDAPTPAPWPNPLAPPPSDPDHASTPTTLPDLLQCLRAPDAPQKQLMGLRAAESLVRASPDELPLYAAELAHVLTHVSPPTWSIEESIARGERSPEEDRRSALVATLVETPVLAGPSVLTAVFGDGADMQMRITALDAVRDAAHELAGPPRPRRRQISNPRSGGGSEEEQRRSPFSTPSLSPSTRTRTRVWAPRQRARRLEGPTPTFVRRLPDVAPSWMSLLLRGLAEKHAHMDVMGRDHVILGRTLVVMAELVEGAARSPHGGTLHRAMLETLRSTSVAQHPQPYVRRMALFAALQTLRALPAAALAGALANTHPSHSNPDPLLGQLDEVRAWAVRAVENEADDACRTVAAACVQRFAALSREAADVLESLPAPDERLDTSRGDAVQSALRAGLGKLHVSMGGGG